jgi:hypothetical protein
MANPSDFRLAVAAHSASALIFFLGFVFLPRLVGGLRENALFLWICVAGAFLSFSLTNLTVSRWFRASPGEAE